MVTVWLMKRWKSRQHLKDKHPKCIPVNTFVVTLLADNLDQPRSEGKREATQQLTSGAK